MVSCEVSMCLSIGDQVLIQYGIMMSVKSFVNINSSLELI